LAPRRGPYYKKWLDTTYRKVRVSWHRQYWTWTDTETTHQ